MKKIIAIGCTSFVLLILLMVFFYLTEKERYYLSDWKPGIWIIGTTTNSIKTQPKVTNFIETEEYFTEYCDPVYEESSYVNGSTTPDG